MIKFVLDTSVAMSWLFEDERTEYSLNILKLLSEQAFAFVPNLFFLEVTNVLLVGERRTRLDNSDSDQFLKLLNKLPIQVINEVELDKLLILGRKHNLSSYDTCYLQLCQRLTLPLATLDEKLKKVASIERISIYNA